MAMREALCDRKTWTEQVEHLDAQVVLTRRAGAEACRQVGELARPVSKVAEELGVCWWTVMNAVRHLASTTSWAAEVVLAR